MKYYFNKFIRPLINKCGIDIVSYYKADQGKDIEYPADISSFNISTFTQVKKYTMTSLERVNAVINAVDYLVKNNISGDMVECGVWKGGSAMTMAITLMKNKDIDRKIYLYDTFSGMSEPGQNDISCFGLDANKFYPKTKKIKGLSNWCLASEHEVKENVESTGYPKNNFIFVKGKVEDTVPNIIPKKISLLRLDTDWYESTKHELQYFFPLLVKGGVLIIDDYGYWKGARKAVDEYIEKNNISILLNRIDDTGRIALKI